ncbi:hypothetical protein [Cellulomonas oligotrophica]|uniref:Uncharacterized protein n=1 Tax=Cellulomonas oligotrophica TaxID=931536 RepID=A0A7Y9FIH6_9CELL|nr:hypothetical protein [Cellulomonas oligotrophica]NYD87672.1 hypothetical protein [Cellulomonas oligotrophica]GIG33123.1 hypothetical protein Col01nite_22820 [Cellulomonas oligotrophica]
MTPTPPDVPADDVAAPAPTGWWRRNRWALAALPFALVLALLASSDRVVSWWWTQGLHRPTTAAPGAELVFRDVLTDADGDHDVAVTLHLDGVEETTVAWEDGTPLDLPPGTRALRVDLTLGAEPDAALRVCGLAVRGSDGTRYEYVPQTAGAFQPSSPCVPPDAPGPWPASGWSAPEPDPTEHDRPATWTVSPVVVLPDDVEPDAVLVWWQMPDYAVLPLG